MCLGSYLVSLTGSFKHEMASQEATSKLRQPSSVEYPKGTDLELLTINGGSTNLFLLSSDPFVQLHAFRTGSFTMRMITLVKDPACMVTCAVGDHLWMLAKDSLALRVGARTFVFSQPGFIYGLSLPCGCSDMETKLFEDALKQFSGFVHLRGKEGEQNLDFESLESCWYPNIKELAPKSCKKRPSSTPDLAATRNLKKAIRMSAAVKLVSRALLTGTLSAAKHFHLPPRSELSTTSPCHQLTMSAMEDLLAAVEAGRDCPRPPLDSQRHAMQGCRFNQQGVLLLLKVMSVYTRRASAREVPVKRPRLDAIIEEEGGMEGDGDSPAAPSSAVAAGPEMVGSGPSCCCGTGSSAKMTNRMERCG